MPLVLLELDEEDEVDDADDDGSAPERLVLRGLDRGDTEPGGDLVEVKFGDGKDGEGKGVDASDWAARR